MNKFNYKTPIGTICIKEKDNFIVGISLEKNYKEDLFELETELIKKTYNELMEYFNGKRKIFDIPIRLEGTEFQKKVWNELIKIPYGESCSYKDIATRIGNPKASRAVGGANNKNPIMIIVPCHRVVGSNGKLVGYACGIDVKKSLLDIENKNK